MKHPRHWHRTNRPIILFCYTCQQQHNLRQNQVHIGGQDLDLWHPCPTAGGVSSIQLDNRKRRWLIEDCGIRLAVNCPDTPAALFT